MSPFYLKEGENWKKWEGTPMDIRVGEGPHDKATILPAEDPEQITISTSGDVVGIIEGGHIVFPDKPSVTINRQGIVFENIGTKGREVIIHSENPIKGEH